MTFRILIADNIPEVLDTRAESLEDAGYWVVKASSPDEVRQKLRATYVHLAILDNRLIDDDNENDRSGLMIVHDPEFSRIPKILLTKFPDWRDARDALAKGQITPPAVDYVDKRAVSSVIIQAVQDALVNYVRINPNLEIHWDEQQALNFPGLVARVEAGLPAMHLPERVEEIEDLFRKLFYDDEQIQFGQLWWTHGQRAAIEVQTYRQGREEIFLVTCGQVDEILNEDAQYTRFMPKNLPSGILSRTAKVVTTHYGAIAWSFRTDDDSVENLQTLSLYTAHHTDRQVRAVLEDLLQHTIRPWVQQGRYTAEGKNLVRLLQEYFNLGEDGLRADDFKKKLEAVLQQGRAVGPLDASLTEKGLVFRLSGKVIHLPDPLHLAYEGKSLYGQAAVSSTTLGGLDADTILLDKGGIWLTDYAAMRSAPIWLNYVLLESTLRFRLADVSSLPALVEMDKEFLSSHNLGETIHTDDLDPEIRKIATCIQTIRGQAAQTLGDELRPYEICLLFAALTEVARYNPAQKRKGAEIAVLLYRILLAGLISEKLLLQQHSGLEHSGDTPNPVQPFTPCLEINQENHEVYVNTRKVSLSPREYDLLLYLYRRAGELCRRTDIVREVFDIPNPDKNDEESLLNTNIGRIRKKIEPDPDHPIYLQTVRGLGFKLVCVPE